jgi:hypothetical protein
MTGIEVGTRETSENKRSIIYALRETGDTKIKMMS